MKPKAQLQRLLVAVIGLLAATATVADDLTIAFGSCLRQWQPQPVWDGILATEPQLFIFAGDNVYADTGKYRALPEPERIGLAYEELAASEGYQRLRGQVPVIATWDDHDYGVNNGGAEYPFKEAAKTFFLDFFDIADDAPERGRAGIYSVRYLDSAAGRIQIILLDTRSFRSPLVYAPPDPQCPRTKLAGNPDPAATLLGADQWAWLDERLEEPAALRLLVSSIQVIPDQHCFEKWANFPHDRTRLLNRLGKIDTGRIIILSGDRHMAEISRIDLPSSHTPIYEITSSGMNSAGAGKGESNRYRITDDNVRDDNFGTVHIDKVDDAFRVRIEIRDVDGMTLQSHSMALNTD